MNATKKTIKRFSILKIVHNEIDEVDIPCLNKVANSTTEAAIILQDFIGDSAQEQCYALYLDTHLKFIGVALVGLGSSTEAHVDIRGIFQHALLCGATNIIIGHNHPTGNLELSDNDLFLFSRLKDAGKSLDIKVLDMIAVSDTNYASAAEEDLIS